MAQKFVKATGLHNVFVTNNSSLNITQIKEDVQSKVNQNSIVFLTADSSDTQYGYDEGSKYIWTHNELYPTNNSGSIYKSGDNISIIDNEINALGYKYNSSNNSFAEGTETIAFGEASHTEGIYSDVILSETWDYSDNSTNIWLHNINNTISGAVKNNDIITIFDNNELVYRKVVDVSIKLFTIDNPIINGSTNAIIHKIYGGIAYGTGAHSEGNSNAIGELSHAEGSESNAIGELSHVEGHRTLAIGKYSHAEGYETIAQNIAEHAEGQYNISHTNTIHSIGIGYKDYETEIEYRKNAIEVLYDGSVYVYGLGGYDGSTLENASTLQEVINNAGGGGADIDDLSISLIKTWSSNKINKNFVEVNSSISEINSSISDLKYVVAATTNKLAETLGLNQRLDVSWAPSSGIPLNYSFREAVEYAAQNGGGSDISIMLNGQLTTNPSFYAPTSVGTNGYVLKSNGSGEPSWVLAELTDTKQTVSSSTGKIYLTGTSSTNITDVGYANASIYMENGNLYVTNQIKTSDLWVYGNEGDNNSGGIINFGDWDNSKAYTYIQEDLDDHLYVEAENGVTFSNDVSIQGAAFINNNTYIDSDLYVHKSISVSNNIYVVENVSIYGSESVDGAMSVGGSEYVDGDIQVGGSESVNGDISVGGSITIKSSTILYDTTEECIKFTFA